MAWLRVDDLEDRDCSRCDDTVHYLSTDGLCDGCAAEGDGPVSAPSCCHATVAGSPARLPARGAPHPAGRETSCRDVAGPAQRLEVALVLALGLLSGAALALLFHVAWAATR